MGPLFSNFLQTFAFISLGSIYLFTFAVGQLSMAIIKYLKSST